MERQLRAGFDCEVTAGFLESGRTLSNVANAAAVIAGIGAGVSTSGVLLVVSLAAWLVESWFAVRVAIDRSLFRTLASYPQDGADWLDALLVDWNLVKAATSRSMADRSRGALRLWRMQAAALTVQLATLAAGIILRVVNH
jgi:hypothetical protein